jgi:hypothetical protein
MSYTPHGPAPGAPKVLISHASDDKQRIVLPFAERLRANGIDSSVDLRSEAPGRPSGQRGTSESWPRLGLRQVLQDGTVLRVGSGGSKTAGRVVD